MPSFRPFISLALRISFMLLIGVLMVLWIVLAAQTVNEIRELDAQAKKYNHADKNKYYDKRTFDRIRGMTVFNTILEEVIALLALLGVLLTHRYLLHTSMLLLAIIWFVAHYRISDLFWYGSPVMIASHVIHFIVVCIGLSYTHFVKQSDDSNGKKSKIFNINTTSSNTTVTADKATKADKP